MIFHFHKTKVSVNLFIVLKISLASHVTLLVIVIITCIHERKSPLTEARFYSEVVNNTETILLFTARDPYLLADDRFACFHS